MPPYSILDPVEIRDLKAQKERKNPKGLSSPFFSMEKLEILGSGVLIKKNSYETFSLLEGVKCFKRQSGRAVGIYSS